MGEEYYAVLKLVSGEEIFSLISVDDNEEEPIIILQNPLIIKHTITPNGGFIKVKPWIQLLEDDFYLIKLDKVITMSESTDKKLIDIYNHYLNEEDLPMDIIKPEGEIKPDSKMGYISSVEDARKNLEDLFNIKEN
tara:strand:+ start:663 stop:1070 length:408 start_codon:yes stop_codon:yes gene_type:complete